MTRQASYSKTRPERIASGKPSPNFRKKKHVKTWFQFQRTGTGYGEMMQSKAGQVPGTRQTAMDTQRIQHFFEIPHKNEGHQVIGVQVSTGRAQYQCRLCTEHLWEAVQATWTPVFNMSG